MFFNKEERNKIDFSKLSPKFSVGESVWYFNNDDRKIVNQKIIAIDIEAKIRLGKTKKREDLISITYFTQGENGLIGPLWEKSLFFSKDGLLTELGV